ncbi:hypothetical protein AAC387_Pa04g0488 [Persea americana]
MSSSWELGRLPSGRLSLWWRCRRWRGRQTWWRQQWWWGPWGRVWCWRGGGYSTGVEHDAGYGAGGGSGGGGGSGHGVGCEHGARVAVVPMGWWLWR